MNPIIVSAINEKFANQFTFETNNGHEAVKFAAKIPEFGDIFIYEESVGAFILLVGNFTHVHFDCYGDTDEDYADTAAQIIDYLDAIFADQVACYGSNSGGGGCYGVGSDRSVFEAVGLFDNWADHYTWSGLYKKAGS